MRVKTNEIYLLGEHRLACGNINDKNLLKKLIGDDRISCILTDPPFAIDLIKSKESFGHKLSYSKTIANDHIQSDAEYKNFSKEWLENLKPYLAKYNSVYIFNSDKMIFALRDAIVEAGYKFSQLLVWIKSQAIIGRLNYLPQHELVAFCWFGVHKFHRSQDKSILFYPKPKKSKLHSTMKPVGLLRNLLLNSTKIGDCVFDGFGGSGSALIACEHLKRKCLMVELDAEHCSTIILRWQKLTGLKAKKL